MLTPGGPLFKSVPFPFVPDPNLACAILAAQNLSLEVAEAQVMIRDLYGEAVNAG